MVRTLFFMLVGSLAGGSSTSSCELVAVDTRSSESALVGKGNVLMIFYYIAVMSMEYRKLR